MAELRLASFANAMKVKLATSIAKQFEENTLTWQLIKKKNKEGWNGKYFQCPTQLENPRGVAAIGEGSPLSEPLHGIFGEAHFFARSVYFRMRISGLVWESSKGEGAWIDAMKEETKGGIAETERDMNRMVWGDSAGILALLSQNAPPDKTTPFLDTPGTQYLERGMRVATYTPGATRQTVAAISSATPAYVCFIKSGTLATFSTSWANYLAGTDANAGGAGPPAGALNGGLDNHYLIKQQDMTHSSSGVEPMGMLGFLDDGTFCRYLHGIDRNSVAKWKAIVDNNGAVTRPLSLALMNKMIHKLNRTGGKVDIILSNEAAQTQYVKLLESDVQLSPLKLQGGYNVLTYSAGGKAIPWAADKDGTMGILSSGAANPNAAMIYFANLDTFSIKEVMKWNWIAERSGNMLVEVSWDTADAVEAAYGSHFEIFCNAPNKNGVIRDIEIPDADIVNDVYDS